MSVIGFSKKFPHHVDYMETRTNFQERILKACHDYGLGDITEYLNTNDDLQKENLFLMQPKIHTMRKMGKRKFKKGGLLHPSTGVRSKEQFQFAPILEVVKVETVEFIWTDESNAHRNLYIKIGKLGFEAASTIGGMVVWTSPELKALMVNDGFSSARFFLNWFKDSEKYDLIYWVDYTYSLEETGD